MIHILLLLNCAPLEIEYTSETNGCTNWDPNLETVPKLDIYFEEDDLIVQRTGVFKHCDTTFTPVIEQLDGYKLSIREYWTVTDDTESCSSCFSPAVRFANLANRKLEFWWYVGDEAISFDVIDTEDAE